MRRALAWLAWLCCALIDVALVAVAGAAVFAVVQQPTLAERVISVGIATLVVLAAVVATIALLTWLADLVAP